MVVNIDDLLNGEQQRLSPKQQAVLDEMKKSLMAPPYRKANGAGTALYVLGERFEETRVLSSDLNFNRYPVTPEPMFGSLAVWYNDATDVKTPRRYPFHVGIFVTTNKDTAYIFHRAGPITVVASLPEVETYVKQTFSFSPEVRLEVEYRNQNTGL